MGLAAATGFFFFAFGPSLALFYTVVGQRSQNVIVCVTSGSFMLFALLLAGSIFAIPGLQAHVVVAVALGVLLQEAMRLAFLKVYVRGDKSVRDLCEDSAHDFHSSPFSDFASAVSSGLGFGLVYALVMYGGMLQASKEPGDYFSDSCPNISGFVVSALQALMMQVLHISLMVIGLDAMRRPKPAPRMALVAFLHLGASLFSAFNGRGDIGGCKVGMPLQTVMVLLAVGEAVRLVRTPSYGVLPSAE